MKKEMDKLRSKIRTNRKISIFLFILIFVGILFGSFFITVVSSTDKELVKEYLQNFVNAIDKGNLQYWSGFLNSLLNSCFMIFIIWILGISMLGIPIILFLLFCKVFTLGFSVSGIFLVYGWKGFSFAFLYIFPHQIFSLLAYCLLVIYALSVSMKLIEAVFKKKSIDFKMIMGKYSIVLAISFTVLFLCAAYEGFLLPRAIKLIIPFIK